MDAIRPSKFGRSVLAMARLTLGMIACCLLGISPHVAYAQTLTGLTGSVTDSTGAAIPDVAITIRNAETGVEQVTRSNGSGSFTIPGLLPGIYDVTSAKQGFTTSKQTGVRVDVGTLSTFSPVLAIGNEGTVVDVTSEPVEINADAPSDSTTVEPRVFADLPIEVGSGVAGVRPRQIDSFIFLTPGATGTNFSHRINGGIDFQNEVLFNGVALTQAEAQGYQGEINPPFESVGEFRVLRSVFSAQYGLGQGAVNYQFRSGTNKLHGDAYEFLRNDFFDAHPGKLSGPVIPVNINKQHDYGFTVGGPVLIPHFYDGRDKFFFNFTYGWYQFHGAGDNALRSAPTVAEKKGDFSALPVVIYDPQTGRPFPNNMIPSGRFSALSTKFAALFPDPEIDDPTRPNILPQFRNLPTSSRSFAYTLDYNLTAKQSIHFTEWQNTYKHRAVNPGATSFLNNPLSYLLDEPTYANGGFLNYSNALRSNLIVQAGVGLLSDYNPQIAVYTAPFNLPGLNEPVLPALSFSGLYGITATGTNGTTSNRNRKVGITVNNNWTWLKGINTFNIGGEVRQPKQNDNECGNCAGHFEFSNYQTSNPNTPGVGGNAFASFLLGLPNSNNQNFVSPAKLRSQDFSFYVQDDLKLTPRLTVNVGFRYDLMIPFKALDNNIAFFTTSLNNPLTQQPGVVTKFGTCDGCAGYERADIYGKHFSPRLGFAYKADESTVFRAGYALINLNGGAFEFGSARVATTYPNLLAGQTSTSSTGGTASIYGEWDKPFPANTGAPFSPSLGLGGSPTAFSRADGRAPYQQDYNAAVQHEFPRGILTTITYSGNRTLRLGSQLNPINQGNPADLRFGSLLSQPFDSPAAVAAGIKAPFPGFAALYPGGGATVGQALRPYPQYQSIGNNYDLTGKATYNALEAEVQKRYTSGFSLLGSYVWSKSMTNLGSGFSVFNGSAANKYDQRAEWSISPADVRHNFKASGLYELPIGRGKRLLNHGGAINQVVGGWQLGAVVNYASGVPLNITNGVGGTNVGALGFSSRPIRVSGIPATYPDASHRTYQGLPILNAAAFVNPGPYELTSSKAYYGDIRSPGFGDEAVNVLKHFNFGDRASLDFRVEYFNVLNRLIFSNPDTGVGGANYGRVFDVASSPRNGQFSLKVVF